MKPRVKKKSDLLPRLFKKFIEFMLQVSNVIIKRKTCHSSSQINARLYQRKGSQPEEKSETISRDCILYNLDVILQIVQRK